MVALLAKGERSDPVRPRVQPTITSSSVHRRVVAPTERTGEQRAKDRPEGKAAIRPGSGQHRTVGRPLEGGHRPENAPTATSGAFRRRGHQAAGRTDLGVGVRGQRQPMGNGKTAVHFVKAAEDGGGGGAQAKGDQGVLVVDGRAEGALHTADQLQLTGRF